MPYRILAINPGSTSTKFALYDGRKSNLSKVIKSFHKRIIKI